MSGSPRHSTPGTPGRSNSAIDASAARRASVRQQYSQRGRMSSMGRNLSCTLTLDFVLESFSVFFITFVHVDNEIMTLTLFSARPRKNSDQLGPGGGLPTGTPDRSGRPRSRGPGGVSQSQPGSRSASPSSIKSYHTYFTDNQSTPFGSSTVRTSLSVLAVRKHGGEL